jgi:hypothetical protein
MAKDFAALRFSAVRPLPIRRHQAKERIVGRRERHPPPPREIRVTFEPSRLSLSGIAQAYEQVVPIVRRTPTRPARRDDQTGEEEQQGLPAVSPSSGAISLPKTRLRGAGGRGQAKTALG